MARDVSSHTSSPHLTRPMSGRSRPALIRRTVVLRCPMARQARDAPSFLDGEGDIDDWRACLNVQHCCRAPPHRRRALRTARSHRHRHEHGRECERSRKVRGKAVVDRQWHRLVIPRNEPANMSVAPNSPSARPSASAVPATSDGIAAGIEIRANVRASDAPRVRAASISVRSTEPNAACAWRT